MSKPKKHILIAEDDTFLLEIMKKTLLEHGVRVSTARNGKEAIDIIDKDVPQLLFLDVLMPHTDGYGVLQHRKKKGLKFPVVACSNLSDKANRDKCKALGVNAYLIKSDIDEDALWPLAEKYLK